VFVMYQLGSPCLHSYWLNCAFKLWMATHDQSIDQNQSYIM